MSAKNNPNIQDKMRQLEELVEWFESDDVDIDDALKNYEKAMKLAGELEEDIKSAKSKFTQIKKSFDK